MLWKPVEPEARTRSASPRINERPPIPAVRSRVDHPIVYPTLGLASEAGEVAGKVKKIFRDRDGVITDDDRAALTLELGDVLWYLAELCTRLDIGLEEVAAANLDKLRGRIERGTLAGDGDTR